MANLVRAAAHSAVPGADTVFDNLNDQQERTQACLQR
jgi:hypothetical protein